MNGNLFTDSLGVQTLTANEGPYSYSGSYQWYDTSNTLKQIAMAAGAPIQKSVPLWCADHTGSAQYTPVGQVLFPDGTFIGLTLEATGRVQSFTLRLVERLRMDMALLIIAFITWWVRSIRPA